MDREIGGEEDQEQIFDNVQTNVMQYATQMKAHIENANLRDALKCCSGMVGELGNPMLSPKFYYIACNLLIYCSHASVWLFE